MAHFYDTPGNVGIAVRREFLIGCGGCGVGLEIETDTLEEAKADAIALGYKNGYSKDTATLPGARGFDSTWRCPECRGVRPTGFVRINGERVSV